MGAFYLISGNEDYAVKERANEMMRALCGDPPDDNPSLEIIRGDSDSEKAPLVLDKLLLSLDSPAFFSSEKIVWLKHFLKFDEAFSEPSTRKNPSRIERLAAFLQSGIPADITLVIDGPGLDRRKAFYKVAAAVCESSGGKLEWFEKADPKTKGFARMLVRRIQSIVMDRGKRIEDAAASFLAETIGADEARLDTEIEKLLTYAGDKPVVTFADCREVCSRATETLAWEFSSALAERNSRKALELIPSIMEHLEQDRGASKPEIVLIYSVMSEFRNLATVKCEGIKLGIPDDASSDYFYRMNERYKQSQQPVKSPLFSMHPFRAYKSWENARRFTDRELVLAFRELVKANRAIVSSGGDARIALELLTIRIASGETTA
jgi:DNA polymerase-3 subunit delta